MVTFASVGAPRSMARSPETDNERDDPPAMVPVQTTRPDEGSVAITQHNEDAWMATAYAVDGAA